MAPVEPVQELPQGWESADLEATARAVTPPGADTDIPELDRFRAGVAKLLKLRQLQGAAESKLAIFLLMRRPVPGALGWARTPMLDNGLTVVGGQIWLVNAPVVTGASRSVDGLSDEGAFALVTDELSLGQEPAIVFDPRTAVPQLRYYPDGLANPENYECMLIGSGSLPLEDILAEVERIYSQHLATPEAQSEPAKLWKLSSKWWPVSNAEKVVQMYLKVGLSRAFPNCTIREEQTQISGRIDLEIEEKIGVNPPTFKRHAILELKVLRSHGATGTAYSKDTIKDWIQKGVEQASAYRDERNALASALCCFDMRKSDMAETCFDHVKELAGNLRVDLRRWYIYASSELYRTATAILKA